VKILSVFHDSLDTSDPTDLEKFQEARAVAYADDGYIKGKLSVALQVLAELNRVVKEDAGLELMSKFIYNSPTCFSYKDIRPPKGHHTAGCVRCGAQLHCYQPYFDSA
jgi:hypothetical protein